MKNLSTHTGKLETLERLKSSANGNPRYRLNVAGFHCVTAPDSSLGYRVKNWQGKAVTVTIGTHYGRATLNSIEAAPETPGDCVQVPRDLLRRAVQCIARAEAEGAYKGCAAPQIGARTLAWLESVLATS